jgi:hypothetical protein
LVYLNTTDNDMLDYYVVEGNFSHNFVVEDYWGKSYFVSYQLEHDTLPDYRLDQGIDFPNAPVNPMGLPAVTRMWIACGLIMLCGLGVTASMHEKGPILTTIFAAFLAWFGMFEALGTGMTLIVLSVAAVVSFMALFAGAKEP